MYKIKNTRLKLESRISIYTKYFIVPLINEKGQLWLPLFVYYLIGVIR